MESLSFLQVNKRRNKNVFGLFYNQNFKTLSSNIQPLDANQKCDYKLVKLSKEPITNQFENIPVVENDEIKNINLEVDKKTNNDITLSNIETNACLENIINQKPLNKIEVSFDEINVSKNDEKGLENMPMPIVKDVSVDKRKTFLVKQNDIKVKKPIKNSIFKKFKYN